MEPLTGVPEWLAGFIADKVPDKVDPRLSSAPELSWSISKPRDLSLPSGIYVGKSPAFIPIIGSKGVKYRILSFDCWIEVSRVANFSGIAGFAEWGRILKLRI